MKQLLLILTILFSATGAALAQLTGTKTIGGSSPDYATLALAAADLNTNGAGPGGVTFNIRDGVYTANITITATGTLSNPIVFQSESMSSAAVTISSSAAADIIVVQGSSYITFNRLTIDYTGTSGYSAIEIQDNADNVTISNCIIDGSAATGTIYTSSAIYASESTQPMDCDNITVSNCVIRNGSYGICINMSASQPGGITISENELENNYAGGMYLAELTAPVITANTIHTAQTGNSSYKGIDISNCDGQTLITGNYIYTESSGRIAYGINFNSSSSISGSESLIANNSIQVSNTNSLSYGLYQSNNSNFWKIYNNTIYLSAGTSAGSNCYNTFTASSDTKIKNNIFINASTATGANANGSVNIANTSGINEIANNCYWTANTGNPFRGFYGTGYTDFAAYIAATGETTSLNIDPQMTFVPGTGWKATNTSLIGAGVSLAEVLTDIDGNTRVTPTSIGAHELDISISVKENEQRLVNAYEWERTLYINSNLEGNAEVNMLDISGRKVLNENIDLSQAAQLNVSSLETGIYVVTVSAAGKLFTSKHFIR